MPLLPANEAFLQEIAAGGVKPVHESTVAEVRAVIGALAAMEPPGPTVDRVQDHTIETPDGASVGVRVIVPNGAVRAVMVYYHGGGWVLGDIDGYHGVGCKLAAGLGVAVVLVDYRLAPEHRYPTAVDDAWLGLQWTAERVADIAGGDVPLLIGGDSAGGNLTAVIAQRSRDREGPALAAQVMVYPVTDADVDNRSYLDPENQLFLQRDTMIWFWDHYVPDAQQRGQPDASPLRAGDLSGLPPAIVILAQYDPLHDEGEAYGVRLREAGVPVEIIEHPGQMHGFFSLLFLPGGDEAIGQISSFLDATLAPAGDR